LAPVEPMTQRSHYPPYPLVVHARQHGQTDLPGTYRPQSHRAAG
jgi:hypothetical protein